MLDFPSHSWESQGKILELIRGAWPERERERGSVPAKMGGQGSPDAAGR